MRRPERLKALRTTPLAILVFLFLLAAQITLLSSASSTWSFSGELPTEIRHSLGLGGPVTLVRIGSASSIDVDWLVLVANLACGWVAAALLAGFLTRTTRLHRPAFAYGLVGLFVLALTFAASVGISKSYWGYSFARPGPLGHVAEVERITAVMPLRTETGEDGSRRIVAKEDFTLGGALRHGREDPYYCLDERVLCALDDRELLPEHHSTDLASLPPLFPLIASTGILAPNEEGYDDGDVLEGVAVEAVDGSGRRLVLLGLTGQQVSNDHRPCYELAFAGAPDSGALTYVGGQRFFYDVAGIEGMEWYAFWILLSVPGLVLGVVVFTLVLFVRARRRSPPQPISAHAQASASASG